MAAERASRSTRSRSPSRWWRSAGEPILWHVIRIYAAHGLRRFLLVHGLQGRADRALRRRGALARRRRGPLRGHGPRDADRRAHRQAGARTSTAPSARPTPTAWPTSTCARLVAFHRGARRAGDDDRRASRAAVRHRASSTATAACAASARSRAPSTGSTAASSASSPGALGYIAEDAVLEREPLEGLAARRPAARLPARRLLGLHGHLQGRRPAQRHLGARRRAVEGVGLMRSAFVTGAYGLLGTGAGPRAAATAASRSRCCAATRRRARRSCSRASRRGERRHRRPDRRRAWSSARWASTRSTPSSTSPPRRSSAPPTARPRPPGRPTCAARGPCSRPAAGIEVERVVVAASDKAYGAARRAALPRGLRAAAALPLRRQQGGHRPDRPLLLAHLRAAGGHDALRQPLRRRGHEPLAAGARGRRRGAGRPAAGDPLRRHARARLPLRRGRGGRLPPDRRRARRRGRARRGLQRGRRASRTPSARSWS